MDHEEKTKLLEQLHKAQALILDQDAKLRAITTPPQIYATVLSSDHKVKPEVYVKDVKVIVINESDEHYQYAGVIVSDVPRNGMVEVQLIGQAFRKNYSIETDIRTVDIPDGTEIVVSAGSEIYYCKNYGRLNPNPKDSVRVQSGSKAVIAIDNDWCNTGEVATVIELLPENTCLVDIRGVKKAVKNASGKEVNLTDRLILDKSQTIGMSLIPSPNFQKVQTDALSVGWEDVGGQEEAKNELKNAIIGPILFPEVFKAYGESNHTPGFLLYGPPGCGKTMLGKAAARAIWEMAENKPDWDEYKQTFFNYLKGPELQTQWVSECEANIRALFERKRKHYKKYGIPSITFIDEAESVFQRRGFYKNAPWIETATAQWLAEMDGFDQKAGIIILASNRPEAIDGAITRPGRIDKHIRVRRPDWCPDGSGSAKDIAKIYLKGIKLDGISIEETASVMMEDIFDEKKTLYTLTIKNQAQQEIFRYRDLISGAMIHAIIRSAKEQAIRRDIKNRSVSGVNIEDFKSAIATNYMRNASLNHEFDLEDFLETKSIDPKALRNGDVNITRSIMR